VKALIAEIQRKLQNVALGQREAPIWNQVTTSVTNIDLGLWMMPTLNLHMTALEITHSLTAQEIDDLVETILPAVPEITDFTFDHRARLVKPTVSYDSQAIALSFLPAAGEPGRSQKEDAYSYHHLRRDLYNKTSATGVTVSSRYVIPSAHLTIARFITKKGFETADGKVDHERVKKLVETIDQINGWLRSEYWPTTDGIKEGVAWTVGEEKGLDSRKGALWYGGGERIRLGKGFQDE